MNRSHLRRKLDKIETNSDSDSHVDSADLDDISVVELLSYDLETVTDDVVRVRQTDELRRCEDAETVKNDVTVLL
jgi:hypothetical protein